MRAGVTRRAFLGRGARAGAAVAAAGLVPAFAGAGATRAPGGTWLPGELHCHSCYSHDVWCAGDDNTGLDEVYTAGLPVPGKYGEARSRGLRFCAVTDHNDVRSVPDLPSSSQGLIAIPGYEHSLHGHAQMLGAGHVYDPGDQAADAIVAMAAALRADGGVFQANHPAYRLGPDDPGCQGGCADCRAMNWQYGFDVRPDTVEVWNPSVSRGEVSENYWECWLERGERIAATGGSDSHWVSLAEVAGPGQPTTWVLARHATVAGVLAALRDGRTSVSGQPPALGGVRLSLSGPGGATIGDTVAPGSTLRVSADGLRTPAVVRIRANGGQLLEEAIEPGGEVTFRAPRDAGWVRALLLDPTALPASTSTDLGQATPQRDGHLLLALTSAMYLRRATLPRNARRV